MAGVENDDGAPRVVDLVQHPPVRSETGTVDTSELFTQGLADSLWVGEKGPGDELDSRRCDLTRKSVGNGPASGGCGSQLVRVGHDARRPLTSARAASAP